VEAGRARDTTPGAPRLTCLVDDSFTPCRFYGLVQSSSAASGEDDSDVAVDVDP